MSNTKKANWKKSKAISGLLEFEKVYMGEIKSGEKYIATVFGKTKKICQNNLSLIESAPEMFEALNKINQMSDSGSYLDTVLDMKKIANDILKKTKQ